MIDAVFEAILLALNEGKTSTLVVFVQIAMSTLLFRLYKITDKIALNVDSFKQKTNDQIEFMKKELISHEEKIDNMRANTDAKIDSMSEILHTIKGQISTMLK
jgi:hypothetical protein